MAPARLDPKRYESPMRAILDNAAIFISFDIVKLPDRLRLIKDSGARTNLVILTLVADSIRFFIITCLFTLLI